MGALSHPSPLSHPPRPTLISRLFRPLPSDEIRDIKPPKLLRRGRKIQELEYVPPAPARSPPPNL